MKRFPEIARRAVSLALAASMSLSVLAPCASAAAAARDLENSVDELGNVDLSDEVFEVPDDTAAVVGTPEEPETPAEEDAGVADDLTEEQLAEQAVVDAAGHEEHTPDTDAEPVYEEPSTCVEAGYAIYPCSFTLEQEDGTVAHCYHQVVVTLPLADHQWGDWQDAADADSQKYRVCEVCGAVEYEDGTVVTPGGIPIVDPDHPEWLPGDGSEIATYNIVDDVTTALNKLGEKIEETQQNAQKIIDEKYPDDHNPKKSKTLTVKEEKPATCTEDGYTTYTCSRVYKDYKVEVSIKNPVYGSKPWVVSSAKTALKLAGLDYVADQLGNEKLVFSSTVDLKCKHDENDPIKEVIPHTGNEHQWVKIGSVAATCEDDGYDLYECSVCKTTKKKKTADKLGHLFTNYVKDETPACQPQTETATCDRPGCEATHTVETGPALVPHEFTEWTVDQELFGQPLYYKSTCNICHKETKRINVAEKKLDELDEALDKDPTQMSDSELTEVVGLYNAAKAAILLLDKAGVNVDSYQKRLDSMETRYKAVEHESEQRLALAAAKEAVKQAEDLINGKDPASMSNEDMAAVLAAYTAAETAVNKLDDGREGKADLEARLAALKKTVEQIEAQYAQKVIEDIWDKLKNGELDKSQLEAFKKVLEDLKPLIPDSLKESYEQVVDAVDAAIRAIDLINDTKALIQKLQEEIKNGNISQDTIKQLQELVKQAGDLVNQIKENPILSNAVDAIIKQAEAALKEAAAKAAVDLVKQAIADGNLEKIDQAFKAANDAIDALEPYMPEVAQQFREELEKLREQVYDKVLQGAQDILNDPQYKSEAERLEALKKYAESLDEILKDYDGPDVDKITAAVKADVANKALDALKEAIENGDLSKIDEAFDQAQKAIDELRPYAPNVADKLSDALEEIKKTYVNGLKDELEKALENGTWQEKLDNLKKVADKYRDLINKIDVSGALKELWDTILNEELTKLITDMANEINKIVNDKDMSALEKIAALNKLSDDLHKKMEDIVGKDLADQLLKPFDDMIEKAKETVAKAAATVGDSLIKEALKAIKQAVDSAESKEDAINKMESIYDQAHELLTKAGMSDADATAKLEPVRSAIDSVKKLLDESFVSMDTIKAAVDVLVDAMLASDTIEGGLHDLVRAVLDGKDLDPAVTRAILVIARDVLKKADWTQLTPSLLDDVMDLVIDKVKEKINKKYISPVAKVANELIDELKPTMNDLVHKEVGQDTIDKVRDVFLKALDNGIDGIDAGKSREDLLDTARDDLLGLSPVVSAELKRIGAKAAESINQEMHDKVEAALPGVILPDLIGDLIGNLAEDIVNDEIGKEDPKITAEIDKYVRYLTCPGHKHATRISQAQGCTSAEIEEDYCTRCGWVFSSTKTADALGHDPMLVPGVEPTEDMDGLTDGVQCARCGAWLEPQEVLPALNPEYDKWFVKADVTAETVKATGYQSRQKLDEAIDSALKKAGFEPANSERFLAQVRTNLEIDEGYILPNDRYPEEGVTGMVRFPAKAPGKDGTYYAVQVVTADNHGYNAGDIVVTPLTVTKEGISLKTGVQAVVAIAWKPNN